MQISNSRFYIYKTTSWYMIISISILIYNTLLLFSTTLSAQSITATFQRKNSTNLRHKSIYLMNPDELLRKLQADDREDLNMPTGKPFMNQYSLDPNLPERYYPFTYSCFMTGLYNKTLGHKRFAIPFADIIPPSSNDDILWNLYYHTLTFSDIDVTFSYNQKAYIFKSGQILADYAYIGNNHAVTFVQKNGRHLINGTLYLGYDTESSGEYIFNNGYLRADFEVIGLNGTGKFHHKKSTNYINRFLYIGNSPQRKGYYFLSGGLIIGNILTGVKGRGFFHQMGGVIHSDLLAVGFGSGNGKYRIDAGAIFAYWITVGHAAYFLKEGETAFATPAQGYGYFYQSGGDVHAEILHVGTDGSKGVFKLSHAGFLQTGATLIANQNGSIGVFSQNGGVHKTNFINIGYSGQGTYKLSHGFIKSNIIVVSNGPNTSALPYNGIFTQNGGQIEKSNANQFLAVFVGYRLGTGKYIMTNGTINADMFHIGFNASGIITQSGGKYTTNYLDIGIDGGEGKYIFNGGAFHAKTVFIGQTGTGVFIQNTGTIISNAINIGVSPNSTGIYKLSDGTLMSSHITIGGKYGYGTLKILNPYSRLIISCDKTVPIKQSSILFGKNSTLKTPKQCTFVIRNGSFLNHSTTPVDLAGFANLILIFDHGTNLLEASSKDIGADKNGFIDNFALKSIIIYGIDPVQLEIRDTIDNQPNWRGTETLYVDTIRIAKNAQLRLAGVTIYCNNLINKGGKIDGIIHTINQNTNY